MRIFTRKIILKSFKAIGIFLIDIQVILKRFRTPTLERATTLEFLDVGNSSS